MTRVKKLLIGVGTAVMGVVSSAVVSFATDPVTGAGAAETITGGMKTALADFSVANIMTIITAALAIAVPLVIGWFAYRFIYKKAKGALKRGS